jgi:adenosylcobinamide-phosphate synthase
MEGLKPFFENTFFLLLCCIIVDAFLGDPVYRYHPIRLLGNYLSITENILRKFRCDGFVGGFLLFVVLLLTCLGLYFSVLWVLMGIHNFLGYIWMIFIGWNTISLKDLSIHTFRISNAVEKNDLENARFHVSMITGRDTSKLNLSACNRAGIESLGESYVDGVLSPLFFMFLFGLPGAIFFKVVSTMDSMVGYKNEKYFYFGKFGARLDDALNYIPARLSLWFISLSGLFIPGGSFTKGLKVGFTQHHPIPGPNAGWSEATLAGTLQKKLVGPIYRNGECVTTLWIGDQNDLECGTVEDVIKANLIIWMATLLAIVCGGIISCFYTINIPLIF